MPPFSLNALAAATLACSTPFSASAQRDPSSEHQQHPPVQQGQGATSPASSHDHGDRTPAVTYAELKRTAEQLSTARQATIRYHDVRVAAAAGYQPVGPNVPGMGIHYVRAGPSEGFDITNPPILLYEPDTTVPGGMRLNGASYLFVAPRGGDGQPLDSPFPKALARWHRHNNVCVLSDNAATVDLSEAQCSSRRGRFTAQTSWMVHAWIWKDSPGGVFSPTNPLIR